MWAYFALRAGWLKINVKTNLGPQIYMHLSALEYSYANITEDKLIKQERTLQKFSDIGFNIKIKTNLEIVDFLDVTLNRIDGTYHPFKKPDDKLSYIHTSSNHPLPIIRQIPSSICHRLSDNSSNEEIFNLTRRNTKQH